MKKFLEKNYKWIVSVLVLIGLFFMVRLWAVGLNTYCSSSGWISICVIPQIEYYWISASYIAVIFLGISIYLIKRLRKIDDKVKKIYIATFILFLGLIGKQVFFVVSPDFKFYLNKAEYKDENNNLVDIDAYLEQTTKYCRNDRDFHFYQSREDMCGGKFSRDYKTVDEYIKIFEHAKNNDFGFLYYQTYRGIGVNPYVNLDDIISGYNDDTFYAYTIIRTSKLSLLKLILDNVNNNNLKNLLINDIKSIEYYYNNESELSEKEISTYFEGITDDFIKGIIQIPEINYNIIKY